MSNQPNVNLSTILKRLEAVTSRLEDVASSQPSSTGSSARSPTTIIAPPAPPAPAAPAGAGSGSAASTPATKAYEDEIINGLLAAVKSQAKAVGGLVEEHTALLDPVCSAQLEFLKMASAHNKPSPNALGPLLQPQANAIQAVMEAKDKLGRAKDGREWGACLSVVGEGIGAWGWVQVEPAPGPYIEEMKNASQFWANRVTKQFKESNPAAVAWSKAFIELIDGLQKYVKQWHTTGVAWSTTGQPAPASMPSSSAGAPAPPPPPGGGPPPPPPPPPADFASPAPAAAAASGTSALLADLNRGGAVTSGLKKVDPSQMTHKNPGLRALGSVPDKKIPPAVKAKPGALTRTVSTPKKPARTELEEGNKWIIEYHEDNKNIVIENTELSHTVHIFNCKGSVVKISGKINAVTMVGCRKTAIVLDSAVSALSITSSPSFEAQITGSVPTITIDTTDSGLVYLSEQCMETVEIITSKTSGINISVPTGADGDFEERPVPEQMRSKLVKGKLVTEIVEHAG